MTTRATLRWVACNWLPAAASVPLADEMVIYSGELLLAWGGGGREWNGVGGIGRKGEGE